MGIDFYIINKTKKEYIWTGRRNPVGDEKYLNVPVTPTMLENAMANEIIESADLMFSEGSPYFMRCYLNIYHAYNILKEYIKTGECRVIDDCQIWEGLGDIISILKNNLDVEDRLFDSIENLRGFE